LVTQTLREQRLLGLNGLQKIAYRFCREATLLRVCAALSPEFLRCELQLSLCVPVEDCIVLRMTLDPLAFYKGEGHAYVEGIVTDWHLFAFGFWIMEEIRPIVDVVNFHASSGQNLGRSWASQKSFRSKDGSDDGDGTNFHGQTRSNQTHESTTDADARLYKKSYGKESKLSYLGHALVENRNGLIAAAMVTHADGYAERDAALLMLAEKQDGRSRRITVGADKAYDTKDFVSTVRELNVTPHVTRNDKGRRSNLDRRTTRQPGYAISLSRRWLIEKGFGWLKQTGPLRQVKLRGLEKVDWLFVFSCAAHNLIRLPKLMAQPPAWLREQCA
jgi:hypothetical protein